MCQSFRNSLFAAALVSGVLFSASGAGAETVDLVLPPALTSHDAPFYEQAQVKIGERLIPVREGALPEGTLARYVPEQNAVIVSNSMNATEAEKGRALLEMMDALQASAIAPAAGR